MKKLILTVLLLLITPVVFAADFTTYKNENGFYASKKLTGTSTNTYPETPNCRLKNAFMYKEKSFFIYNTGDTNALDFKITAYPTQESGVEPYTVVNSQGDPQTDIEVADGGIAIVNLADEKIETLEVYIKSSEEDQHTTYLCVATGLGNR
jgi:hypothetical protein